jgi:hypothetical protein
MNAPWANMLELVNKVANATPLDGARLKLAIMPRCQIQNKETIRPFLPTIARPFLISSKQSASEEW